MVKKKLNYNCSVNIVLGLIDLRRRHAQKELNTAITKREWSKVAGWDGIDIGLMMAEKIVKKSQNRESTTHA